MSELAERLLRSDAPPEIRRGVVSSRSPLTVLVEGAPLQVQQVGGYRPQVGDMVVVVRANGAWTILGWVSSRGLPSVGTVTATSVAGKPSTLVVTDEFGIKGVEAMYFGASPPTVGTQVGLDWSGSMPRVLGAIGAMAAPPAPKETAPTQVMSGEQYFPAVETSSWREGSWWNDKPAQYRWGGWPEDFGAWFYGGAPRQQLAGAQVEYASMYLRRIAGGASAAAPVHLWHHTSDNRAGGLTYTIGPFDVPLTIGQAGYFQIPNNLAQALISNGGGIGIKGAPYAVLASKAVDPQSGTLFIRWRKLGVGPT